MAGLDMSISGLASGFDWKSVVDQLTAVERTPQNAVRIEQSTLAKRRDALGQIASQLNDLQTKATALGESSLYTRRSVSTSDATVASVSAATGAVTGSYSINVATLATPASWLGASSGIISPLHSQDVNTYTGNPPVAVNSATGPVLSEAGWGSSLTAGTVTIGRRNASGVVTNTTVTVATTDTLKGLLVKLDAAIGSTRNVSGSTGGATYSTSNDQVTLAPVAGESLILGAPSDTSNLLSCLKLFTPASGASAVSDSKLGSLKLASALSSQPLVTPLAYGTTATIGTFSINGVSIDYSSSSTLSSVLNSINDSAAGVQASFDSGMNRIVLKNKEPGNRGVVLSESSGSNFLTAFGLTSLKGGTLSSGTDLEYSINGGATAKARSNTITDADSGLTGLTITAFKVGTTTIASANDTGAVRSAVDALISSVNRVQSLISSLTVSNRDAAGKITAGVLAYDQTVFQLGSNLRSLLAPQLSGGPSTTIRGLTDLGYSTSGYTNELSATNSAALTGALSGQLTEVQKFFSTTTTGLSARITTFVKPMVDEISGTLPQRQKGLTEQSTRLDEQLVAMERRVQANRERLLAGFRAMEAAQAKSNSQIQFLNQKLGISA
jgi:flagellar hook-associated protein 2